MIHIQYEWFQGLLPTGIKTWIVSHNLSQNNGSLVLVSSTNFASSTNGPSFLATKSTLTVTVEWGGTVPDVGVIVIGSLPVYLSLKSPARDPSFLMTTSFDTTFELLTTLPKLTRFVKLRKHWGLKLKESSTYISSSRRVKHAQLKQCFSCLLRLHPCIQFCWPCTHRAVPACFYSEGCSKP